MSGSTDLGGLFEPRSVAVIGASGNPDKVGHKVLGNILHYGYGGAVYPVNPRGGDILGLRTYGSMTEVEGPVDLALIVVPAPRVYDAVKDCGEKGVKFVGIITSGFSEVGEAEEERRVVDCARTHGMRVLGPNIFGLYSAGASLNATFGARDIRKGNVAIITQSGALGVAMMGKTLTENIGLSAVLALGNKADLDEADLVEHLTDDPATEVIFMYVEGIKGGERLVPVLRRATASKPVIVLKSGRSKRGAQAAASHTGSLAGADSIFSDIMRQCGVMRAENLTEALNWCKFLSRAPPPRGTNTVIVTNGGGMGVLAADACEKYSVDLFDDREVLAATFGETVPAFGSAKNPVDITGAASLDDYVRSLEAAFDRPDIHAVICLGCETAMFDVGRFSRTMEELHFRHGGGKPVVYSFLGGREIDEGMAELQGKGVPAFPDIYEAVSCLGACFANYRNTVRAGPSAAPPAVEVDVPALREILQGVRREGRNFLLSHEAQGVMRAAGVPVPQSALAPGLPQAVAAADSVGYPVVMKVVSKDIIHKSDAGGVVLDLQDRKEVMDAYEAIMHRCRAYDPSASITGVEVVEMVPEGTETIIGARRDGGFGPVVMFGLGGIFVEVMKDVSFRAPPLSEEEAVDMLAETRSYQILLGARGEKKKDIGAVVDVIARIGTIIRTFDEISDIEVNPLTVYEDGKGALAVDVRIILAREKTGEVADRDPPREKGD